MTPLVSPDDGEAETAGGMGANSSNEGGGNTWLLIEVVGENFAIWLDGDEGGGDVFEAAVGVLEGSKRIGCSMEASSSIGARFFWDIGGMEGDGVQIGDGIRWPVAISTS